MGTSARRALLSNPWWMKRIPGTVCVTAAGMFGKGAGWGIPISAYTLSFDHEIVDGAPAA